jgi:hypothetical protein
MRVRGLAGCHLTRQSQAPSSQSCAASHCENTSATFLAGPRFWHQMSRPSGEQAQTKPSSSGLGAGTEPPVRGRHPSLLLQSRILLEFRCQLSRILGDFLRVLSDILGLLGSFFEFGLVSVQVAFLAHQRSPLSLRRDNRGGRHHGRTRRHRNRCSRQPPGVASRHPDGPGVGGESGDLRPPVAGRTDRRGCALSLRARPRSG